MTCGTEHAYHKSMLGLVYIRFHAIHKMLGSILQTTQIQGISQAH